MPMPQLPAEWDARASTEAGFGLVELVLAVIVLGIMAFAVVEVQGRLQQPDGIGRAVHTPVANDGSAHETVLASAPDQAARAACIADTQAANQALELYNSLHGGYPTGTKDDVLKALQQDGGSDLTAQNLVSTDHGFKPSNRRYFLLYESGEHAQFRGMYGATGGSPTWEFCT